MFNITLLIFWDTIYVVLCAICKSVVIVCVTVIVIQST